MDALRLEALDAIVDPFCQAIRAGSHVFIVFHFAAAPAELSLSVPQVRWKIMLDSAAQQWGGNRPTHLTLWTPAVSAARSKLLGRCGLRRQ